MCLGEPSAKVSKRDHQESLGGGGQREEDVVRGEENAKGESLGL